MGPVFQSIVNLTSSLMTNSLTVVAKVISNTLIFLLQKCCSHFFSKKKKKKKSMYLPYFRIEIVTSRQLTTSLNFEQLGPKCKTNIVNLKTPVKAAAGDILIWFMK